MAPTIVSSTDVEEVGLYFCFGQILLSLVLPYNLRTGYYLRYLFDTVTNDNVLVGDIVATTCEVITRRMIQTQTTLASWSPLPLEYMILC